MAKGHAWQRGACMAKGVCGEGRHVWDTTRYGDTINERAVRIPLECILVFIMFKNCVAFS